MNAYLFRTKTLQFIMLFLGIFLALSFCITGCASNASHDEKIEANIEIIEDSLKQNFDQVKSKDFVNELSKSISNDENLAAYGVSASEMCEAWLSDFNYDINNVTIEGNKATANLTLHIKPLNKATNEWNELVDEQVALPEEKKSEALSNDELGKRFIEMLSGSTPQPQTIDITYTQNADGIWEADESYSDVLRAAFLA